MTAAVLPSLLLLGAAANPLRDLDAALTELTAKVSLAVVQILTTGYGPMGGGASGDAAIPGRQQGSARE